MDRFTVRLSSSHKPSGNTKPLVFKNPILTASGTFGYGVEFANYGDLTHLGGIVVKGLSLKPRPGNPLPRVAETPCGMLNAVGLQNDGVESFLKNKLPRLPWHETPVIANLYATSPAEFAELAGILAAEEGIAGLEVNISCPNVKNGGVLFGQDPALAAEVTQAVKKHAGNLPVIVKLSPNVTDITAIAKAAEQAGADAISCINTITGMGVDVKTRKPLLANVVGGLSGPAVKPVALRCVWQVCNAVKIPGHRHRRHHLCAGRSGIYPRRCARGGNRDHELRPPRRRLPDSRRTSPSVPATWYQKPRRVPRHPATVIH